MATTPVTNIESFTGKEIKVYGANYDNSQMDQEGFLKVLLAAFAYQDPFEAQDISQFIDNTVKLRQLESYNSFEKSLQKLVSNDAIFLNATNMIGKKVVYEGVQTYVENGKSSVTFIPKEDATFGVIYVYDENNTVVAKKEFHNLQAGKEYSFAIDNPTLEDGYYNVSVQVKNGDQPVSTTIYSEAYITGIERDEEGIVAAFDKGTITIDKITKIGA